MRKNFECRITYERQRGFTLVELMVSVFISTLVLFSVFYIMSLANTIFRSNDIYSRLNHDAMQTLRSISREVGQTSPNTAPSHLNITTDGSGNSVIRFQIPVDWDNDGDADTGGLNPQAEWGSYDQAGQTTSGRLNGWVRYSVINGQLTREVLDSSLNVIGGITTKIIANNIQTFTVTKTTSNLAMNLSLMAYDVIGRKGSAQRQFPATFTTNTLLRNAVT